MGNETNRLFIAKVENFIEENHMLSLNDHVVMGVSGGADSVALFVVMNALKEKYALKLSVVHVHHGLRKEAEEEAMYVKSLCDKENVDFHLFRFDVNEESRKASLGTEETGRMLRYRSFESIAADTGKIAIAHNLNDRAETMLFHLCRGTGPKGMAAIKAVNGRRIRPLLCVERKEIEEFLNSRGIKFYVDASNLENDYTRNKLRNQVFPILERDINKEAISHMGQASMLIESQNEFISQTADRELEKALISKDDESISVHRSYVDKLHISVKRELIKKLIDYMVPGNRDITLSHIDKLLELLGREGNYQLSLPYEIKASLEYDELKLFWTESGEGREEGTEDLILEEGSFHVPNLGRVIVSIFDKDEDFLLLQKEYTKYFDYDKIRCCLKLRKRLDGDYLTVNSNMGKKKLKDFFIDRKIPKNDREKTWLIADGSHIVWVVGHRISEFYKVTENTGKIISIQIMMEDK